MSSNLSCSLWDISFQQLNVLLVFGLLKLTLLWLLLFFIIVSCQAHWKTIIVSIMYKVREHLLEVMLVICGFQFLF